MTNVEEVEPERFEHRASLACRSEHCADEDVRVEDPRSLSGKDPPRLLDPGYGRRSRTAIAAVRPRATSKDGHMR